MPLILSFFLLYIGYGSPLVAADAPEPRYAVNCKTLPVHSDAAIKARRLRTLQRGDEVAVYEQRWGWGRITPEGAKPSEWVDVNLLIALPLTAEVTEIEQKHETAEPAAIVVMPTAAAAAVTAQSVSALTVPLVTMVTENLPEAAPAPIPASMPPPISLPVVEPVSAEKTTAAAPLPAVNPQPDAMAANRDAATAPFLGWGTLLGLVLGLLLGSVGLLFLRQRPSSPGVYALGVPRASEESLLFKASLGRSELDQQLNVLEAERDRLQQEITQQRLLQTELEAQIAQQQQQMSVTPLHRGEGSEFHSPH
ncbi:MAG: hypothetical protein HQL49_08040 [Gammaproteobacteria bacterium]|nr:hypothetical protein [Gammaproteobacteria bacterium]